jgi:hypothetical protein
MAFLLPTSTKSKKGLLAEKLAVNGAREYGSAPTCPVFETIWERVLRSA